MICKKCNTLNSNDAKVCVNCGQKVGAVPLKTDTKQKGATPSTGRLTPNTGKKPPVNTPSGKKKKSNLGLLLLMLLVVVAGGGYIIVNTESGREYLDDLKKNQMVGEYISMADSLLRSYISEFVPSEKTEEPEVKEETTVVQRPVAREPQKPVIQRIQRDMLYYTSLKDGMRMVLIPSGPVKIGSELESDNEKPVHEVFLKEFYIDEHEVTVSQFRLFVEETGYKLPRHILFDRFNGPRQPIVGVSYDDAEAYARWAGKRLPTEYEWEKAARGGLESLRYPFSNEIDPTLACYDLNPSTDGPSDVKSYGTNDFKLYDIAGNVAEWTSSEAVPYPGGRLLRTYGEDYRVIRGGSWRDVRTNLTVSIRDFKPRTFTSNGVGFRCVMDY